MTNHYTDVCEETIEFLRQQLADMTKERDKAKAMPMKYRRMEFNAQLQDENEALRQQLADHIKREVMLRDALETCEVGDFSTGHVIYPSFDEKLVNEALAATADLSGLVLCDAEPAGYEVETMDKKKMLMRVACYLV